MPLPALPQYCPTPRELDDLELLVSGALAPTVVFNEPGSPVTLTLPDDIAADATAAGAVELVDPEGLPLAQVSIPSGTIEPLTHPQYGPFRRLYLSPSETRRRYAGRTFVPLVDALTGPQLAALATVGPVVLMPLVGHGTPNLSPVALIRATLAAAQHLPTAAVVAVPLASHGDADVDHELGVQVATNYSHDDPMVGVSDDPRGSYPPEIAAILRKDRPPHSEQGLVLFFTGLSGSGKSTLARALMDRLLESGTRTVTSLDGDVVRRNLSAGLTFSREDRETNIRRIGWVAAEISRHGGIAICSPIAPFDQTRQQVRQLVREAGGAFFLVHVATPLEECERRDRKGLYAKARRGEIPEFTGISSPYEEPDDADVRVDTTGRTIDDALDDVVTALHHAGFLDLTRPTTVDPFHLPASTVVKVVETIAPKPDPAVEAVERPLRVLFVCTANTCRSPFMELLARHLAGPDAPISFASAGTHGVDGKPMDLVMAATLTTRGVPGADTFRSHLLGADDLRHADLVLTAETANRQFVLDEDADAAPTTFTLGQFASAVAGVDGDLQGRELVAAVAQQRAAAGPAVDIPDPYGQGPDAAEACASDIEALLTAALPALTGSRKAR